MSLERHGRIFLPAQVHNNSSANKSPSTEGSFFAGGEVPIFDVVNHKRNDCIFFHTTTKDRLDSIFGEGLKINSIPSWQSRAEPWVYLSTVPWDGGEVILNVNLSDFSIDEARSDVGWAFVDDDKWEERWQLRVFKNIPPDRISKC